MERKNYSWAGKSTKPCEFRRNLSVNPKGYKFQFIMSFRWETSDILRRDSYQKC